MAMDITSMLSGFPVPLIYATRFPLHFGKRGFSNFEEIRKVRAKGLV